MLSHLKYWPSDSNKIRDLLDFFMHSIISSQLSDIEDDDDLSSDHTPMTASCSTSVQTTTNVEALQNCMDENIQLNTCIKAGKVRKRFTNRKHNEEIRELVKNKRKLRRKWQRSRNIDDKKIFNQAGRDLSIRLDEIRIEEALKNLKSPTKRNAAINDLYGIWCKSSKCQSKADAFSNHLEQTFQTCPMASTVDDDLILKLLDDKIGSKAIRSLSTKNGIIFLTLQYNSVLRVAHFPMQWKCPEIVMMCKPNNKPENEVSSYRTIDLLPLFSKMFEKLSYLENPNIIPDHKLGFRYRHESSEQCHPIGTVISEPLEKKLNCCSLFLDVKQAFHRVWLKGNLKIKTILPTPYYLFLKSNWEDRAFFVKKISDEKSGICNNRAGVPQGFVPGPVFTADIHLNENTTIATYADKNAFLTSHQSSRYDSSLVQGHFGYVASIFIKMENKH